MRKKRKLHLPQSKLLEERRERRKKANFKKQFQKKEEKKNISHFSKKNIKAGILKMQQVTNLLNLKSCQLSIRCKCSKKIPVRDPMIHQCIQCILWVQAHTFLL